MLSLFTEIANSTTSATTPSSNAASTAAVGTITTSSTNTTVVSGNAVSTSSVGSSNDEKSTSAITIENGQTKMNDDAAGTENAAPTIIAGATTPITPVTIGIVAVTTGESNVTPSNTNNTVNNNNILSNNNIKNDKGLPKAMVKPQVLTHVIEGFVFQESDEAFPVNRQRYPERDISDEPPSKKRATTSDIERPSSPTLMCEHCGKVEQQSKMKKKKYCSMICAKAAKNSITTETNNSTPSSSIPTTTSTIESVPQQASVSPNTASVEPRVEEVIPNGRSSPTIIVGGEEAPLIVKWTVADVYEFIKNLPGCKDYAEDFAHQEIDGQALLLLKENHLVDAIGMKLGPALKIIAKVDSMRVGSNSENGEPVKAD